MNVLRVSHLFITSIMRFVFVQFIINIQNESDIYLRLSLYDTLKGLKTDLSLYFEDIFRIMQQRIKSMTTKIEIYKLNHRK